MKKKSQVVGSNQAQKADSFRGFFNPVVGDDAKKAVKALPLGPDASMGRIVELVSAGFKVSFRENRAESSYMVTVYDARSDSDSQGYAMTLFHRDLATVIGLAWFLQDEVYEWGGWGRWIQTRFDTDW